MRRMNVRNDLIYPNELPTAALLLTLEVGDIVKDEAGCLFEVESVYRSVIPGEEPQVKLKPYSNKSE